MTVIWDGPSPRPHRPGVSRRSERIKLSIAVEVCCAYKTHQAQSVNIGEDGMAAVSATRLMVGNEVALTFKLPGQYRPIEVIAIVRHVTGYEHGYEFWRINSEDRSAIIDFLERNKS